MYYSIEESQILLAFGQLSISCSFFLKRCQNVFENQSFSEPKLKFMKLLFFILIFACSALAITAQARKVFPYQYQVNDLQNGLRVVTVPTDYPNLVSFYTVVVAGSRNEVEDKKSGYAHFFEHLM